MVLAWSLPSSFQSGIKCLPIAPIGNQIDFAQSCCQRLVVRAIHLTSIDPEGWNSNVLNARVLARGPDSIDK